jgi:DNA mismatch repair ATPase MutS
MKVFLLYPDRDFALKGDLPPQTEALIQDLELDILLDTMAQGDTFLRTVARQALLSSLEDPQVIRYRQMILQDCLNNPDTVRELYQIPVQALITKQKQWLGIFSLYPSSILSSAVELLEMFVGLLRKMRRIVDENGEHFHSPGFQRFFNMIRQELDEAYFVEIESHLKELRFRDGVLISAELGMGNEGQNYVLCRPKRAKGNWMERVFSKRSPVYSFSIPPRDDHGAKAIGELRDRGINSVANAVAQSADHIDSFLNVLRVELGFYVACLNLAERLAEIGEPIAFPEPYPANARVHTFRGLYEVCLALTLNRPVVGNELNGDGKDLVMITGANQGGKSTFLRSIGVAQLMMQCGMFVGAESFAANCCSGLFTHYKREEDATMKSGKFDEELGRMSEIVNWLKPNALVLFNESFAATNEHEGSEIARQIVKALIDRGIKVFFVTHMYELAHRFYELGLTNALFLRAERQQDGQRTFKLREGEPLPTSFGQDVFQKVFQLSQQQPG